MTGHTKEPWDVFAQPIKGAGDAALELVNQVQHTHPIGDAVYLLNANGKCPATTGCGPTSEANARRIVDCVNALAGIENPAAFVEAARGMMEALAEVMRAGDYKMTTVREWKEAVEMGSTALTRFRALLAKHQQGEG